LLADVGAYQVHVYIFFFCHIYANCVPGGTGVNLHSLPNDVDIVEVRTSGGYGARWTADGAFFRGLLEPQIGSGGHESKWRH
jgi:hypothetical protein